MKVLFICNNAYNKGNGLSVSALNTIKRLRERGVDARLMAVRNPDPEGPQPDFPLEHFVFPIFEPIIAANGFCFAKVDRRRLEEAIDWADVLHFEEALPLEYTAMSIARKKGKTCVGTFHLFPHNVTANLGFPKRNLLNNAIMKLWNSTVFNHCSDVQCPTEVCREYIQSKGTKACPHVISNGIALTEENVVAKPYGDMSEIRILCIGRLANEKSQNTLIDAIRYSRHADKIKLIFCGNGPKEKLYRSMADKLYTDGVVSIKPEFGFYTHEELEQLARDSYLYIHCAWVEVEGLSCLEATRVGAVPVIAEGDLIGTTTFALCEQSRYPVYDSKALAERIDWWIEHPEERDRYSQLYADGARRFDVNKSISALIAMYEKALAGNGKSN